MKDAKKDSKFLWIGNSRFLDFVNTTIFQDGRRIDLFVDAEDVKNWIAEAGFSVACGISHDDKPWTPELLARARDYRNDLRLAAQDIAAGRSIQSHVLRRTNQFLQRKNHCFEMSAEHSVIALRDRWTVESPDDVCTPIAYSFAKFVSSANLERVHKCKNPECILFFYDTSKSGTRAWCSLDICGNKMRVAAFRKRAG